MTEEQKNGELENGENFENLEEELNAQNLDENVELDSDEEVEDVTGDFESEEESEQEFDGDEEEDENNFPTVSTDVEVNEEEDNEANELYSEFKSFLEDNEGIKEDKAEKQVIPTGIDLLDAILGGGFAVGTMTVITGLPGTGKSTLAAQILGHAQKINKGKLIPGYLDSEQSMTSKRLYNLGVRRPPVKPYTDMTVERVFKYIEGIINFKEEKGFQDYPSMVIWDSVANTLSEKEMEAKDTKEVIGQKQKLLSLYIPKYVGKCDRNNICIVAINQLRDKMEMGGFPKAPDLKFLQDKDMPGGQSLKFNAFHLLNMTIKSEINRNKGHKYPFDGLVLKAKCVKNKLFAPNIEIELISTYSSGFSNFWTNYNFLVNTKRLKSGGWNYLINLPQKKFRTKDAEKMYKNNKEFREAFDEAAREGIQNDIINEYGD